MTNQVAQNDNRGRAALIRARLAKLIDGEPVATPAPLKAAEG